MYYPEKEAKSNDRKMFAAARIRLLLDERKITIRALSEMTGITERMASSMVDTKNPSITVENLCRVAEALDVSLDWLTGMDNSKPGNGGYDPGDPFADPGFRRMVREVFDAYFKNRISKN